jgi:hypothetical protein
MFVQPENVIALRTASKAAGVRFVDTGSLAGAVAQPKENRNVPPGGPFCRQSPVSNVAPHWVQGSRSRDPVGAAECTGCLNEQRDTCNRE